MKIKEILKKTVKHNLKNETLTQSRTIFKFQKFKKFRNEFKKLIKIIRKV